MTGGSPNRKPKPEIENELIPSKKIHRLGRGRRRARPCPRLARRPRSRERLCEGGSASESVLYDRATNLFAGGSFTSTGNGKSTVREFVGTSANPTL